MRRLDITALSSTYAVRPLTPEDVDAVLALAAGNELFYRYHPPLPDRESILSDMTALPRGRGRRISTSWGSSRESASRR